MGIFCKYVTKTGKIANVEHGEKIACGRGSRHARTPAVFINSMFIVYNS
jgi:hypothetical protein